uniref:Ubiquitin-like domain-containing protein n=1 Tax=Neolamprologus brichardi TaxID=32507 RepID=A0A3Q4GHP1_NEOBR
MGKICQVKVFGPDGDLKVIELSSTEEQFQSMTVKLLRDKIRQLNTFSRNKRKDLRLIFTDKLLCVDSNLLRDYGIQHTSIIQVEPRVPGGGNLKHGG